MSAKLQPDRAAAAHEARLGLIFSASGEEACEAAFAFLSFRQQPQSAGSMSAAGISDGDDGDLQHQRQARVSPKPDAVWSLRVSQQNGMRVNRAKFNEDVEERAIKNVFENKQIASYKKIIKERVVVMAHK